MADLVFYLLVFLAVGSFFLFVHMLIGKTIRPSIPEDDKLTIYECGEPTVGSAWIQFDLRYYVVALLFVVFDVEVAFFFPWAVVFGTANRVEEKPVAEQTALIAQLQPTKAFPAVDPADNGTLDATAAKSWAWIAFLDILVFFGVLMVGFAYLWKRGDIDWVRAAPTAAAAGPAELPFRTEKIAV
ncbi:MAG: NADH-quinone oxidoreductase subunit A [Gemmataceae bacterium]|nr:NADH-quinone oxidoreductase subunit A [Gemmataceae bacterium]